MPRCRADERVVHPIRLSRDRRLEEGREERGPADVGLQRAPALEVDVDIHAAVTAEDLEPEDVGALYRVADVVADLGMPDLCGEVRLRPQPVLPAGVVALPRFH